MDEGEVTAFVEALAEFHASTYFLMMKHPGGKEGFLEDYPGLSGVNPFDENMEHMMRSSIEQTLTSIEAIVRELVDDKTADKIAKFRPHAYGNWVDAFTLPWGDFATIIHGDSWFNNVMFRLVTNLKVFLLYQWHLLIDMILMEIQKNWHYWTSKSADYQVLR